MTLSLGIDTGGTYTDAVIHDDNQGVVAKAKALTTRHDLSIGLGEAMERVLAESGVAASQIGLVSISTTLATNALVEGQGGRIGLVMIGFADSDLDRAGLREALRGDPVVFVAGGLGLAPLRPAIYHVLNNREHYTGMTLVYGARSPDDLLYAEEVRAWKSRFDTEIEVTVDHAAPGWTGCVGVVTVPLDRALAGNNGSEVSAFVCGPEIMMRFSVMSLMGGGVPEDRIWISMERNMKCAIGFCGHCQFGGDFICRDGPVFRHDRVSPLIRKKEI